MYAVVFITASNKKEAEKIALGLIKNRLAACVNIVDKVESLFWWQGKIDRAKESLLIVKTKKALVNKLIQKVKAIHSYEVPEVIALPIISGSKDYLGWLGESIKEK